MDVGESLDREVIVERAEMLRGWLAGLGLPGRTTTALNRELAGIIENDPGGYIDGRRPLAGLTVDDFIAELERPGAGAVAEVRSVGEAAIRDLRAAMAAARDNASARGPEAASEGWQEYTGPADEGQSAPSASNGAAKARRSRARKAPAAVEPQATDSALAAVEPQATDSALAAVEPQATDSAPPAAELANGALPDVSAETMEVVAPKRRGRPRKQAAEEAAPAAVVAEDPPKRRGRPRKQAAEEAAPAAVVAEDAAGAEPPAPKRRGRPPRQPVPALVSGPASAPAAAPAVTAEPSAYADPALEQLAHLWPSLHPQARRAVVLYTSTLLAEGQYKG